MILNHKIIGEGRPLYILHGLFGSLDNWNTLGKRFAQDRQVILVDQRNHGRSFHDDEMNYEVMADDLVRLMAELGHSKGDLLGHSMGGKTVMKVAMDHPEFVDRLIVADIGPQDYPSHHEAILDALFSVDLTKLVSRSEAKKIINDRIKDTGVVQFLTKNLYWIEKGKLAWRMNLEVISNHMEEILSAIGTDNYDGPCLFLRGTESDYIQENDLMALHMQFTNSNVVSIAGAGHWLHAEKPDEFFTLVHTYLNESAL